MTTRSRHAQAEPTEAPVDDAAAPAWAVGIVHYDSWDDLASCLDALALQRPRVARVRVYDVDPGAQRRVAADAAERG